MAIQIEKRRSENPGGLFFHFDRGRFPSQALVLEDKVFFTESTVVHALDAGTGNYLWKHEGQKSVSPLNHFTLGKKIYLVAGSRGLTKLLDANSGKLMWSNGNGLNSGMRPPSIEGINIVFPSSFGRFQVLDGQRGELKKTIDLKKVLDAVNFKVDRIITGGPVLLDKGKLFGSYSGKGLICIDYLKGKIDWQIPLAATGGCEPAMNDKVLVLTSTRKIVYCIDKKNGNIIWNKNLENILPMDSSVICRESVFIRTGTDLTRFRLTDGKIIWKRHIDAEKITTGLAISNGFIIYGCQDGTIRCLGAPVKK